MHRGEKTQPLSGIQTQGYKDFILDKMPLGVIIYGPGMDVLYCNPFAENLSGTYQMPDEIETICGIIKEGRHAKRAG